MKITLLVDNTKSWIYPYIEALYKDLKSDGHAVSFVSDQNDITEGDCAFFLGCEKLVKKKSLNKNKYNLVVHESALPEGKGWSPLTWQILEGKNDIPITLFEAMDSVDSGDIYTQETMYFEGHELNLELKDKQGQYTIDLVKKFIKQYPNTKRKKQTGKETFYAKRSLKDSELDINKTIAEQFNLLRVVDNERYPAFFNHRGYKYILKIEKSDE